MEINTSHEKNLEEKLLEKIYSKICILKHIVLILNIHLDDEILEWEKH